MLRQTANNNSVRSANFSRAPKFGNDAFAERLSGLVDALV
jgi:hypothetical protein